MAKRQTYKAPSSISLEDDTPKTPVFSEQVERRVTDTKEIWSDTFKLTVAPFIKRDGLAHHPDENPGDFLEVEHVHFYRTSDSDGRKLDRCTSIANHFHVVKTAPNPNDPNGAPQILEVSGPMRLSKKRVMGRNVLVPTPINNYDFHTHGIEYVKSGKIKARVTNIEAQKVLAHEAQKGAPVAGVQER